jgi:hypothetical protein
VNHCILIEHNEIDSFDYDPIASHFRRFGIEANGYWGNTSRLWWRSSLDAKAVVRAIQKSPLLNVAIPEQKPWCDHEAAESVGRLLSV